VRERVADLSKRISVIHALLRRQGMPTRVLEALADVVPPDLRLTSLEGRGLALRALGSAPSATAVADLMSGLHASGVFSDVDIVVSRQDLGAAVHSSLAFEIACRFKD
jgi:type IV pilus assembly protein PilN